MLCPSQTVPLGHTAPFPPFFWRLQQHQLVFRYPAPITKEIKVPTSKRAWCVTRALLLFFSRVCGRQPSICQEDEEGGKKDHFLAPTFLLHPAFRQRSNRWSIVRYQLVSSSCQSGSVAVTFVAATARKRRLRRRWRWLETPFQSITDETVYRLDSSSSPSFVFFPLSAH